MTLFRILPLCIFVACEISTEKDPEGPADYSCFITITGVDEYGSTQVLLESDTELSCYESYEKDDYMREYCDLEVENYDAYSDVDCTWSCTPLTECSQVGTTL